ncbi:MAG TPA: colanic acid biosynthesis glycosyltransferase WcaL [Desulfobacteraceae bacterium]|nr:colanic acid biosynthesis glycosyltransferase WcaL [Desulfobacteraceae bacterium]
MPIKPAIRNREHEDIITNSAPLRILFLMGYFPSVSTTFIFNQITGLLDLGHNVSIAALKRSADHVIHPQVRAYDLQSRTRYINIPRNRILRILKAIFLFFTRFHAGPARILKSLNVVRFGKNALNLNLFYYILPFLGRKYDVIHCHFGPNGTIGAYLSKLGLPGKIITTFYGYDLTRIPRESPKPYAFLFKRGSFFLPICDAFRRALLELGCPSHRITVHPIGIDTRSFVPPGVQRSESGINILTAANFMEKKGYAYALEAVARVMTSHDNVHYLICGDGPLRKEIANQAKQLNITGRITFTGMLASDELILLYARSHIFLLPSVTAADGDQEGTPTVLLEAQAMELPVVSSRHSGIPEIVQDGKTGMLNDERDVDGIAACLETLVSKPGLRLEMGREGRKFVTRNFDIRDLNKRLLSIYQQTLQGG